MRVKNNMNYGERGWWCLQYQYAIELYSIIYIYIYCIVYIYCVLYIEDVYCLKDCSSYIAGTISCITIVLTGNTLHYVTIQYIVFCSCQ